jgi:dCTP diphosphatase
MNDSTTTLDELKGAVRAFSRERDWEQFHNPKDLAVALVCEIGEVLEHVRYRTDAQIDAYLSVPDQRREFAHELADCLWLLLRIADVCDIDLSAALVDKLALAAVKYPVDKVFGKPDKYTTYQTPQGPVD